MIAINFVVPHYTQPGYLEPIPRLHAALRFRFHPVPWSERSALVESAGTIAPDKFDLLARQLLVSKLVDWSLVDPDGSPVPVSQAAIDRLQPELFLKLYRVVLGYSPSDIDPLWTLELREQQSADQGAAQRAGKTIGEVREERDEKN